MRQEALLLKDLGRRLSAFSRPQTYILGVVPNRGFEKFDPVKRQKYLGILREGVRRRAAARAMGIHPTTVSNYRKRHSGFAREESLAETEAIEEVETSLYRAAVGGSVPAARMWLRNRDPANWDDRRFVRAEFNSPVPVAPEPSNSDYVRRVLANPRATELALELLDEIADCEAG